MNDVEDVPRVHRSMQEAWGPYTSNALEPMPGPPSRRGAIVDVAFAVALGLSLGAGLVSWLVR